MVVLVGQWTIYIVGNTGDVEGEAACSKQPSLASDSQATHRKLRCLSVRGRRGMTLGTGQCHALKLRDTANNILGAHTVRHGSKTLFWETHPGALLFWDHLFNVRYKSIRIKKYGNQDRNSKKNRIRSSYSASLVT